MSGAAGDPAAGAGGEEDGASGGQGVRGDLPHPDRQEGAQGGQGATRENLQVIFN